MFYVHVGCWNVLLIIELIVSYSRIRFSEGTSTSQDIQLSSWQFKKAFLFYSSLMSVKDFSKRERSTALSEQRYIRISMKKET